MFPKRMKNKSILIKKVKDEAEKYYLLYNIY